MELNEYQDYATSYVKYPSTSLDGLIYTSLGLAGETGEFVDKVKKIIRDDGKELTSERREALIYELGDTLWYLSQAARELETTLEDVAVSNLTKLGSRQARGVVRGDGDNR